MKYAFLKKKMKVRKTKNNKADNSIAAFRYSVQWKYFVGHTKDVFNISLPSSVGY